MIVKNAIASFLLLVILTIVHIECVDACADFALAPNAHWQIANQNNALWLMTPCGERFFSIGVNVLDPGYPQRIFQGRLSYHWQTFYPDLGAWSQITRQRVLAWGFNTAGAWSAHPSMLRLPIIPDLEIGRVARYHWFDPFRPDMEKELRAWAHRLVAPYKDNPYRIGYFSDNEVGWWHGALFNYYLNQPATNHTKQKLLWLLREHYGDDWHLFARDFVPPPGVASFDALLAKTGAKTRLRPGGQGMRVIRQWVGIVAEHYYRLVRDALREADPDALFFGDRLQIYYDPAVIRAMASYIDVVATNYDVDSPDGWIARYYFDGLRQLTANKPILISEWFFAAHENRTGNRNNGHLMTVQTQAERAHGAMAAAQQLARDPEILGIHWFQYYDHPAGGRPDGEDYNFGLVDVNDRPYEALVEGFSRINPGLAALHPQPSFAAPVASTAPVEIPAAEINTEDRSLGEWPKERALIHGLAAQYPDVVFGDMYMAWSHAGLYLATISMDYYDPELLAFGDTFPVDEAFRLEWGVDAGAGPRRFGLYVIPPKVFSKDGASAMRLRLCRNDSTAACTPVPAAVANYFGGDGPRIVTEVFLPWDAMGVPGPPPDSQLRVVLTATGWHRARWMSWTGQPPAVALRDSASWHTVRLGKRATMSGTLVESPDSSH